jgi:DNA uptake protein ComE-like DNA-binding protein
MTKVKLKRDYVSSSGNRFMIGTYNKNQLPIKIRDDLNYIVEVSDEIEKPLYQFEETVEGQITLHVDFNKTTPQVKLINVNTATKDDLLTIKGIGEKTAISILEQRPFKDFDQFITLVDPKKHIDYTYLVIEKP